MHTPTKAQFQTVIDNLKRAVNEYGATSEDEFDMSEGQTSNDYGTMCGTVHCIGGWYAIATLQPFNGRVSYVDGANQMALDLGFKDHFALKDWAHLNSITWGNDYGYAMFSDEAAYNNARSLPQAINHLEAVRYRLPE